MGFLPDCKATVDVCFVDKTIPEWIVTSTVENNQNGDVSVFKAIIFHNICV